MPSVFTGNPTLQSGSMRLDTTSEDALLTLRAGDSPPDQAHE